MQHSIQQLTNAERVQLSRDLVGDEAFTHWSSAENNKWLVGSNRPFVARPVIEPRDPGTVNLFHGTTLTQCQSIMRDGYTVGRHRAGDSVGHPSGIYGTDHPGHSFDRTHTDRGWTAGRETCLSGWDTPVALCWQVDRCELKRTGQLATGSVYVLRMPHRARITIPQLEAVHSNGGTQIWIHQDLYARFLLLPALWPELVAGTKVVCRAPEKMPHVLYRCGNASPMTCGRTVARAAAEWTGWMKANGTKQWYCPQCRHNYYSQGMPCTEVLGTHSYRLLQQRRRAA